MIIFFQKKNFESEENTVYKWLIVTTFVETVLEIVLDFFGPLYTMVPYISYSIAKFYCVCITLWNCLLCTYVVIISLKMKNKEQLMLIKNLTLILSFIFVLLTFVLFGKKSNPTTRLLIFLIELKYSKSDLGFSVSGVAKIESFTITLGFAYSFR